MDAAPETARGRVLVVGAGVGGLSAAIHLRLAGFDVAVFEARSRVGGRASRIDLGPWRFDSGPTLLNYPWVFEELFARAGRRLSDAVSLIPVDPSVTFLWPDGETFSLSSSMPSLTAEVERLSPGDAPGLWAFLADGEAKYRIAFRGLACRNADSLREWLRGLSPREALQTRVWRSLDAELGRFFKSRRIRDALGAYAMYLGGSPGRLPGLFTILPYGELAYGLWLPKGGMAALVEAVERLALDLGVVIETGRTVRRILVEGRRAAGVEFDDGLQRRGDFVVSNVDVPTTVRDLLPARPKPPKPPRMTPSVFTFYLALRDGGPPTGHHTICMPEDARRTFRQLIDEERVPDDLPFYASVASRSDPSLAPAGGAGLFLLAPAPVLSRLAGRDPAALREEMRERIMQRLAAHSLAPKPETIEAEACWTPADWAERFGLADGSAFGAAHTLFQMGPWRPPNRDPHVERLYYAGASTVPGTGVPLVALSGRMAAERICADAR